MGPVALASLVGGTMMMALSVYVDAWWHEAIGRDSFWIPPHLGIYSGLVISLLGFLTVWRTLAGQVPRSLWLYAAGMMGVVVSGYADELWHQRFGVEKVGTLAALWSPTHVAALVSGSFAALGIIRYLVHAGRSGDKRSLIGWLLACETATLVSIVTLLVLPLGPETPFRLLGVWGGSISALIILGLRFYGSALAMKPWALTVITGFNWTGNATILTNHAPPEIIVALLVGGVAPAVIGDLIIQQSPRLGVQRAYSLSGIIWGVIFGSLFYPLTNGRLSSSVYDAQALLVIGGTSALASFLAGTIGGSLAKRWLLPQAKLVEPIQANVGSAL